MKKFFVVLTILLFSLTHSFPSFADIVIYNTKTQKIHSPSCPWAKKCTVNCIKIERSEAVKRGGVPCKVCNGGK